LKKKRGTKVNRQKEKDHLPLLQAKHYKASFRRALSHTIFQHREGWAWHVKEKKEVKA